MLRTRSVAVALLAGATFVTCTRAETTPRKSVAPVASASAIASASAYGFAEATALCQEIFPCPAHSPDSPPFMCALSGSRVTGDHVPGLAIEEVSCLYRKAGESAVVGVPDDGSRPLVRGDALLARVRGYPRAHALVAIDQLTHWTLDEGCPITEDGGLLRYCVRGGGSYRNRLRCVVTATNASACATADPDRFLPLCRRVLGAERFSAERYWGPGINVLASDHVKDGQAAVARMDELNANLRVSGKTVRVLTCTAPDFATREMLIVDGRPDQAFSERELLPKLDTLAMRAALLGTSRSVTGTTTYLLLDPTGGPERAHDVRRSSPRATYRHGLLPLTQDRRTVFGSKASSTSIPKRVPRDESARLGARGRWGLRSEERTELSSSLPALLQRSALPDRSQRGELTTVHRAEGLLQARANVCHALAPDRLGPLCFDVPVDGLDGVEGVHAGVSEDDPRRAPVAWMGQPLHEPELLHRSQQLRRRLLAGAHELGDVLRGRGRLIAHAYEDEAVRRAKRRHSPLLQPSVQLVDDRAERHRQQAGERYVAGRGRSLHCAHGGVKAVPSASRAWPPTGKQTNASSGSSPSTESSKRTPGGTTMTSPGPAS